MRNVTSYALGIPLSYSSGILLNNLLCRTEAQADIKRSSRMFLVITDAGYKYGQICNLGLKFPQFGHNHRIEKCCEFAFKKSGK